MENQLVTILRIIKPQVGSFVKNRFEAQDIECFFTNEGLALGSKYNPDEVLLKVKVGQAEKAIKLLLQLHKDYNLDALEEDSSYTKVKKILLAVKLSDESIDLCKFAISVAKKNNAEIKLLYVYEDPTIIDSGKYTVSWEKYIWMELQEAHKKAQLKLVNFSLEIKKAIPAEILSSVKLHYRMLKGEPEYVITDAAERYQPDLIIMGSGGKKQSNIEFHGRTISRVIDNAKSPVLVVPPEAYFKGKEKINVMYATDFYDTDNDSLNRLLGILNSYEKQIICVHIDLQDDSFHQNKVKELNEMLAKNYSVHNIKCVLYESDNVAKGIESFAEQNEIDLISFSKMKRSAFYKIFHSSILEKLVAVEKIPILIFPV